MSESVDPQTLDQLVQNMTLAADSVAVGFQGTGAERTRATIRRAVEAAIGNGLITVTPQSEWPEWIVVDPPYQAAFPRA
jgi:hypothetical protein